MDRPSLRPTDLGAELRTMEAETFEVVDNVDAEAAFAHGCSTSSCTSTSSTTSSTSSCSG